MFYSFVFLFIDIYIYVLWLHKMSLPISCNKIK